jgi:hypothetical protein
MYHVYHIVDPRDDNLAKGYVGVTKQDPADRFKDHRRGDRIIGKAIRSLGLTTDNVRLLFSYPTAAEAYAKEEELRPDNLMGWNQCKGGRGGSAGPLSEEARESRRRTAKRGADNPQFGHGHTPEVVAHIKHVLMTKHTKAERSRRAAIGGAAGKGVPKNSPMYTQAALNRPKYTCPKCNKVGQYNSMVAWHGDNCRTATK